MLVVRSSPEAKRSARSAAARNCSCRDAPAQYRRAHVAVSGLLLGVNPDMVAVDIGGRNFLDHRIQLESDTPLEFGLEARRGPPVAQEKILQAGALAALAQFVRVAEDFGHASE